MCYLLLSHPSCCCHRLYHFTEALRDPPLCVFFSPEPPVQSPVSWNGFDPESDVYKMLQDYEEPVSEPKQSGSFKYLQEILEAEDGGKQS